MSYLKKYKYVNAILEFGGITQAAAQLKISQPTFSKYLKKLETDLGVELFDRSKLPMKLTKAGECFVEAGRRILDIDRQLNKRLDEIKETQDFNINVGISPSRYPFVLPKILSSFMEKIPNASVVIVEKYGGELARRLNDGEIDMFIGVLSDETKDFERIELYDEGVFLAVPKANYNGKKDLKEVFANYKYIIGGAATHWTKQYSGILAEYEVVKSGMICQSIESAFDLVKQGMGITIVPSFYMTEQNIQEVEFLPLSVNNPKRKVCLFYRKEQFLSSVERAFIDCVIEQEKR